MGKGDIKQERWNHLAFNFNRTALFFIGLFDFSMPFLGSWKRFGWYWFYFYREEIYKRSGFSRDQSQRKLRQEPRFSTHGPLHFPPCQTTSPRSWHHLQGDLKLLPKLNGERSCDGFMLQREWKSCCLEVHLAPLPAAQGGVGWARRTWVCARKEPRDLSLILRNSSFGSSWELA